MGEEETLGQHRSSFAAPIILLIVFAFEFLSRWLKQLKKRGLRSDKEFQLRRKIKQLLKEASSFWQPSTFVQAAKLKRLVTAKEKELANFQELQIKEIKLSYDLYLKVLRILKYLSNLWNHLVGVIPWLILSTRVSKFVCGLFK